MGYKVIRHGVTCYMFIFFAAIWANRTMHRLY